jgi:serine/threonine-protein kinase
MLISGRIGRMASESRAAGVPMDALLGEGGTDASGTKVGRVIAGRYRLCHLLGKGGMGEVWRAEHVLTHRLVAIKFLKNDLAHREDLRRRFLREARATVAVNHPNVVEILDTVQDQTLGLVMPLLEGETLAEALEKQSSMSLDETVDILKPLLSAVEAAHAQGVVHRDLKPANIFLQRGEREGDFQVKVLDFGVAKLGADQLPAEEQLTVSGCIVGTPCYMAPEQALGEPTQDHRVDIWAVGVIAYEMLAGCRPIEGDNLGQVVRSMLSNGITPIQVLAPGIPESLSRLVMKMLKHDPALRPQSADEVLAVLNGPANDPACAPEATDKPPRLSHELTKRDATSSTQRRAILALLLGCAIVLPLLGLRRDAHRPGDAPTVAAESALPAVSATPSESLERASAGTGTKSAMTEPKRATVPVPSPSSLDSARTRPEPPPRKTSRTAVVARDAERPNPRLEYR